MTLAKIDDLYERLEGLRPEKRARSRELTRRLIAAVTTLREEP